MYDVAVIGGGVIGAFVLRNLARYKFKVCLLEKENDVCMGQSKANSGIVHAGFDAIPGTLKAKFNAEGAEMMPEVAKELGVKYIRNGSIVVAFTDEDMKALSDLCERAEKNGVSVPKIIDKKQLKELEPNVSDEAIGALYAEKGGIVCPYELTIAAIGNAMDNGAELFTCFSVDKIDGSAGDFTVFSLDGKTVKCKTIVNCAGLNSAKIAALVGDDTFKISGRKGEYILLDKECGGFVGHTLFFAPTKMGKGILVSGTVDGNTILGPTAENVNGGETDTTQEGLTDIIEKAKKMCPSVPLYFTITSFAGVRAYSDRHDFIIEESPLVKGFINCAGIESPGLTSAPAIGKYVVERLLSKYFTLELNEDFNPIREPDGFFKDLSDEEKTEIIKKDPRYGKIVCRCEKVTEGEIVRAIKTNPPAKDIDAVKRRTRSTMGRCQGGFCQPYIAEILSRELNIEMEKVTKFGIGSEILKEITK